jgi:recombination protein RecR
VPILAPSFGKLVEALRRLPGIGPKSAERIAFHLLKRSQEEVADLAQAILEAKRNVKPCSRCFFLADSDPCPICANPRRDQSQICVVEDSRDVLAMERSGGFRGLYHVLGGAISPLDGVGPGDLHIAPLLARLGKETIAEVIVATNPTMTGDTTAIFLAKLVKERGVRITRIAHGLPVGTDLELADELTLSLAMQGRREL